MTNKVKGRRGLIQRITRKSARGGLATKPQKATADTWTAVHAPRVTYAGDHAPERSWWAEASPEEFGEVAREEYQRRMRFSDRQVGQRGIDG